MARQDKGALVDGILANQENKEKELAVLTPGQYEILTLVRNGYSTSAIARKLEVSRQWVHYTLGEIYRKLYMPTLAPKTMRADVAKKRQKQLKKQKLQDAAR